VTPRPTAIILKDEDGNPVIGPTGEPIQMIWDEFSGNYKPLPITSEETDEVGNRIRVTINPVTGESQREYLTREPIPQLVGGRMVFVDPVTGQVISAVDRPPVEQEIGGVRVLIDPDTGEVVHTFPTEAEQRQEQIQTAMPLLQQLAQIFSQPGSRLRFLAQEGAQQGLAELPDFSLLDILGSLFGGGEGGEEVGLEALQALGLPTGGQATVTPRLAEILGLPAGSPIPLGGLPLTMLPDPEALRGLTSAERQELDALFEIATGGTRLSDVERKVTELTPPGGLGGGQPTATFRR
jgi:hypothetical protein